MSHTQRWRLNSDNAGCALGMGKGEMNFASIPGHTCRRCGHTSTTKTNLLKHLRRKNKCETVNEDIDVNEYIELLLKKEYKDVTYSCDFCESKFNTYQSRWRHHKVCKQRANMDKKDKEILLLKKELEDLKAKMNITNITNNTTQINIQNNITLKDFGHENISHLPHEFLNWCFANKDIVKLMENIHCDKEHPENHNIRIRSQKRQQIETRENDKWTVKDEDEALTDCIRNGYRILVKHAYKHKNNIIENELENEDEYDSIRHWLDSIYDDHHKQKPIKRNLLLLFLSKHALILGKEQ